MLRLILEAAAHLATPVIGPATFFRLERGTLMRGLDREPLARYDELGWLLEGGTTQYTRMRATTPVLVHFEDEHGRPSGREGPFSNFFIVDGVAWADNAAYADMKGRSPYWTHRASGATWLALLLEEPTPGRLMNR